MIVEKRTVVELEELKKNIRHDSLCRLIQAFFREKIFFAQYIDNQITLTLPNHQCIFVTEVEMISLARLSNFKKIYVSMSHVENQRVEDPLLLLKWIIANQDNPEATRKWQRFYGEIENHLRNNLLFKLKKNHTSYLIKQYNKKFHFHTIFDWIKYNNFSPHIFFEQWGAEGHPHHPCNKTKLGFSDRDIVSYSPEFSPKVPIYIAAASKKYVNIHSIQEFFDFPAWFNHFFPDVFQQWKNVLNEKNYLVEEYVPFPIHPWQAKKILPDLLKKIIPDQALLLFKEVFFLATPTLSFRTLAPTQNNKPPYIKLPIAVQATSTLRTLSPHSAVIAPKITILLNRILKNENNFKKKLFIIPEVCGLSFKNLTEEMGKHLTVIFRENIESVCDADETGIVVAALLQPSPISDLPLLIEILNSSGIDTWQKLLDFFNRYTEILLGSYLKLYLRYGITLEGHQQNTVAVFQNGQFKHFIARDLEGSDIHLETFKKTPYDTNLIANSHIANSNKDRVRNGLIHTVYQAHLGNIISMLCGHYMREENILWQIVAENTKKQLFEVRDEISEEAWITEYNALLIAEWPCKALLKMRFADSYNRDGLFTKIDNPLCGNLRN